MAVIGKAANVVFIKKRDGEIVDFDPSRIKLAIQRAMDSVEDREFDDTDTLSGMVRDRVVNILNSRFSGKVPTVEDVQDIVEETLILDDFAKTAKHYILYRNERARLRSEKRVVPQETRDAIAQSKVYFDSDFSEFIFWRSYSRWNDDLGRRETWVETVDRYMAYMSSKLGDKLTDQEFIEIRQAILHMEAMPSMRLMWSAGVAADFDNACAYNCSYIAISELRDFAETLYLLMCGCGVGFSAESQCVQKLPLIKRQDPAKPKDYYPIADSKQGWADVLLYAMQTWYDGGDLEFDYSLLRPAGARLKTMGGRSSGPDPLRGLLSFTRQRILAKQGSRLSNLDVHDIICKIGECVVAGGVRRSSLISLSDLHDSEMRDAKQGHFFLTNNQRQLANNSVAYTHKPSNTEFMSEWLSLAMSGSGERGIFNRGSLAQQIPSRRLRSVQTALDTIGTNPCGEIFLQSKQFCNLTEVVARADDDLESLKKKVRIAAILGTYQSMLTDFNYLSDEWKINCEAERLLGVSVTGQWDSPAFRRIDIQRWAKAVAVDVNEEYAERFGINKSAAITCVKPSGTVSQLVNAASGCHPRYARHYIRRVRISASDSLFQMMRDQGYPFNPDTGQTLDTATTFVVDFPVKAPQAAITRHDVGAIEQLEYWKQLKTNYTEHNPSCTIYVAEDEWLAVGSWVYANWDIIGGLSFLPKDDTVYSLAPFEEITEEQYQKLLTDTPNIDFSEIVIYEQDDQTEGSKEYACVGTSCEI